jgi:hypothetical protein
MFTFLGSGLTGELTWENGKGRSAALFVDDSQIKVTLMAREQKPDVKSFSRHTTPEADVSSYMIRWLMG